MACMEHNCGTCGEMWFNNNHGGACPKCGSHDISSFFDEAPEPYTEQEAYDHEHPPLRDDPMETGWYRLRSDDL